MSQIVYCIPTLAWDSHVMGSASLPGLRIVHACARARSRDSRSTEQRMDAVEMDRPGPEATPSHTGRSNHVILLR